MSVEVTRGQGAIVLGLPHTGLDVPPEVWAGLNDRGRELADTDWHIDRLYNGLRADVTIVRQTVHRYVIDVNRGADDASLYPGQATTGLCPVTDFDGAPIHLPGHAPDSAEVAARIAAHHTPYHAALSTELARIRAMHGVAIVYDCHSIRSRISHLFEGTLPDFNIGTNLSTSCAPLVEETVEKICRAAPGYATVVNGRFRGGWTTRHHGRPAQGIHAVQMELAQSTYMEEAPPWRWDEGRAARLRATLALVLDALQSLVDRKVLT